MTQGFLVIAQNSDVNYVRQAYALALSIKATQPTINNISIVIILAKHKMLIGVWVDL